MGTPVHWHLIHCQPLMLGPTHVEQLQVVWVVIEHSQCKSKCKVSQWQYLAYDMWSCLSPYTQRSQLWWLPVAAVPLHLDKLVSPSHVMSLGQTTLTQHWLMCGKEMAVCCPISQGGLSHSLLFLAHKLECMFVWWQSTLTYWIQQWCVPVELTLCQLKVSVVDES